MAGTKLNGTLLSTVYQLSNLQWLVALSTKIQGSLSTQVSKWISQNLLLWLLLLSSMDRQVATKTAIVTIPAMNIKSSNNVRRLVQSL
jgi:hypothetical protein